MRQICDWCRLVWKYRDKLNLALLKQRICAMGVMSEWKAFAALTVDYFDMPVKAMPLYSDEKRWHMKGDQILDFIMKDGVRNKMRDILEIARIFPVNTLKFLPSILFHLNWVKIRERIKGE